MTMSEEYIDFDRFIETFELSLDKEFECDGVAASWAPSTNGGPQLWGDELDAFRLDENDPMSELAEKPSAELTMSPDGKLMAIATNSAIRVYTVEPSKVLTAEFDGHQDTIQSIHLWNMDKGNVQEARYVVLSQDSEPAGADGVIFAWYLDEYGKRVGDAESPAQFEGRFLSGSAATTALSCDKTRLVHSDRSITTQGWPRPSNLLPQLVIRSLSDPLTEVCRLKGHQDFIKWASWSPTDPNIIASASWDESCRIWNAATGECIHNIQGSTGRNWTGDFSPNGEQILFAGGSGSGSRSNAAHIAIYTVATGTCIQQLELPGLASWSTPPTWSPDADVIALVVNRSVILWDVAANKTTDVLTVHSDGGLRHDFCGITSVKWLQQKGSKLLVRITDHTVFIWDRQRNCKWRLQRPPGLRRLTTRSSAEAFIGEKKLLLSLDGDWQVRTWEIE